MEIQQSGNRFHIDDIAEITFYTQDDAIVINHTFVDPSLRGQGIARQLLDRVIDYARENNLKIVPLCSYAVTAMHNDPSVQDVLK
ncbi:GNAT family N-acetyltransferase [Macrococcus bovicus]|uniref:GNAT family N-acetyltransferase n=1 Tax=Macrococcus bovicus TaxID=69968 RepID=UPI0025A524FF|nr:GNAT family N-acetyltransferase [Macrococcus bovicus]WJP97484.1 GNAT family N-acetyltransferase [Macrococcus bovicus]